MTSKLRNFKVEHQKWKKERSYPINTLILNYFYIQKTLKSQISSYFYPLCLINTWFIDTL